MLPKENEKNNKKLNQNRKEWEILKTHQKIHFPRALSCCKVTDERASTHTLHTRASKKKKKKKWDMSPKGKMAKLFFLIQ